MVLVEDSVIILTEKGTNQGKCHGAFFLVFFFCEILSSCLKLPYPTMHLFYSKLEKKKRFVAPQTFLDSNIFLFVLALQVSMTSTSSGPKTPGAMTPRPHDRDRKIGHRRVDEDGQVTYKKVGMSDR